MSSLLDGIDVAEKASGPQRSGPNPKVIKVAVACVLFVAAGVFVGMQTGLIPSPFGGGEVRNAQGEIVPPPQVTHATPAEVERLRQAEEQFIANGGTRGES
jgi:hypothetical protein